MTTPMTHRDDALHAVLARLVGREEIGAPEIRAAFRVIMRGEVDPGVLGGLLVGLKVRGDTPEVLVGIVEALREVMLVVDAPSDRPVVDTCGTGGGSIRTLNISTAAAFVAAGAGVTVAKHGNRSNTSRSGSADVLEALGVGTHAGPEEASSALRDVGIAFLFAPVFHPAMRHVIAVRRSLAVPTVMNLVGPLANPARVTRQVIGVSDPTLGPIVAGALARLGCDHGLVVHGEIGLDEIAPVGRTRSWEVVGGGVRPGWIAPAALGLEAPDLAGTEGGSPEENAQAIERLLVEPGTAPRALRNAVLLNAAAAVLVSGVVSDLGDATALAIDALEQGKAADRLHALRRALPLRTSG